MTSVYFGVSASVFFAFFANPHTGQLTLVHLHCHESRLHFHNFSESTDVLFQSDILVNKLICFQRCFFSLGNIVLIGLLFCFIVTVFMV